MIIDHYGAIFHGDVILYRIIGRLAFPIYAFLLVEGYFHTRNVKKYGLRLFIFALISEIPFDYAFYGGLSFVHQNIFFTLFLGLVALYILDKYKCRKNLLRYVALVFIGLISELFFTDYGLVGIIYIVSFYNWKKSPNKRGFAVLTLTLLATNIIFALGIQLYSLLALPLIYLYNGKLGPKNKLLQWSFYVAYPLHLFIFYILKGP